MDERGLVPQGGMITFIWQELTFTGTLIGREDNGRWLVRLAHYPFYIKVHPSRIRSIK